MLHSLHLCLCGKPHPFRLHTQSLVSFVEPVINLFEPVPYLPFQKKATVPYMVLKVYHLNCLSNILMFLASLQEPLTSNFKKNNNKKTLPVLTSENKNVFLQKVFW